MTILEIEPHEERPKKKDIEALYDKYARRGGQVTVCRAPDELLQYHNWTLLDDRAKLALGRIEVALSRNNFEECHRAIDYIHRGGGRWDPIDTTCADLGMSNRQLNALERKGITHIWQLLGVNRRTLLTFEAISAASVDDIIRRVKQFEAKLRETGEFENFCLQAADLLEYTIRH